MERKIKKMQLQTLKIIFTSFIKGNVLVESLKADPMVPLNTVSIPDSDESLDGQKLQCRLLTNG
jgi:hypothetical protein